MSIERAIAALKTGRPVRIGDSPPLPVLSVETATVDVLDLLDPQGSATLLLSGPRAAALSLGNMRDAADPADPVLIERSAWLGVEAARELADPGRDFDRSPGGPLKVLPLDDLREPAATALKLARRAGLLPALWVIESAEVSNRVSLDEIERSNAEVTLISRAKMPLDGLPPTQIAAFRAADDGLEHVALIIGAFGGKAPLVRLHSECLTGDVFGSLRCDCGPQLKEALRIIAESGGGIVLYLRQEGRGIGLANKLRAYSLQDRGVDTVEANLRLGFADDERDYAHAAAILSNLGADTVRLLTNNPKKVEGLEKAGIRVVERVGHRMAPNPHNMEYLATKRRKSGHIL